MDVLRMADFETKGKQKVNVHYVNAGVPCVVEENFEGYDHDHGAYLLADVLQHQETVYQSLQGTRGNNVVKASSCTHPGDRDWGQTSAGVFVGNSSESLNTESQFAIDEALARELQYEEDKFAATSLSETTITEAGDEEFEFHKNIFVTLLQGTSLNPGNGASTAVVVSSVATRGDDVNPDNMTYEELQSLGEVIGSESRGLSDELISYLPSSTYKTGFFSRKDKHEECVICCMSYKNREVLITLPCKHHYHSYCVKRWLKINKVCPVCNEEVFGT